MEPSQSPYCNGIVQVKKKDGSIRTCIDMRRANEHTRFDAFPLARIDDSLDMLGKAQYMSTLDNSSAFWSILLHPDAKPLTAFGTRALGQWQFKRMPFGLKNATATYARALTHVLRGLIWTRCVLYCDDSIIWGEDYSDHMDAIHQVFKRYSIHTVNIKIEKCHFACRRTEFVGHEVEVGKDVRTSPAKVEAMVKMGKPKTVQELKSFIGMAAYYKRFIKDFAHIAMPLRRIENVFRSKTMSIERLWGPNQEKSFTALKAAMAEAPVLAYPDFKLPFIVISDCSDVAKGATLAQIQDGVERPILYMSQALNEHELKYGISDREGCAATWAIRAMRGYLRGAQVILVTDHSSLLALVKGGPMMSMRQQRYAMDLSEHSLTIVHRAGPNMHLADALSRCGYSRDMADTTVERIQKHPQELCSVEEMRKYFKPGVQYEYLRAWLRAAEGAQVNSIAEEYERLST